MLDIQKSQIPDYTLLCKRAKTLDVSIKLRNRRGPINILVDSTGLKVFGEGEWKVRTHGKSKRRTWRKVHIALNEKTGEGCATQMTLNNIRNANAVSSILSQIGGKIKKFYSDETYGKRKIYQPLKDRWIIPIILPQKMQKSINTATAKANRLLGMKPFVISAAKGAQDGNVKLVITVGP